MGHAKRWDTTGGVRHVDDGTPVEDDHITQRILHTQRILQTSTRAVGGDPVAGIRNAVIVGTLVWIALALASAYFLTH